MPKAPPNWPCLGGDRFRALTPIAEPGRNPRPLVHREIHGVGGFTLRASRAVHAAAWLAGIHNCDGRGTRGRDVCCCNRGGKLFSRDVSSGLARAIPFHGCVSVATGAVNVKVNFFLRRWFSDVL